MDEGKSITTETIENQMVSEPVIEEKKFCVKCGAEIFDGQEFCPKCGQKVGAKLDVPQGNITKHGNKKMLGLIIIAVAIIGVVFIAIRGTQAKSVTLNKDTISVKVGETATLTYTIDPEKTKNKNVTWSSSNDSIAKVNSGTVSGINEGDCTITVSTKNGKTDTCTVVVTPAGPDFQAIYNDLCTSTFASVASDGSYLTVDTNPKDEDSYTNYEAYLAIMAINEVLELPESVLNKMNQTRSIDGIQSYSTDELDISWTYHPNRGLEVNYSLK